MSRKTPSYKGLKPASESASRIKQNNRRSDTKHELLLRSQLWNEGLRFRKNVTSLPGKPDIVFPKTRIIVFCDGDFWHGKNWNSLKDKLDKGANPSYWSAKIASNMERDKRTTALLEELGWFVIRVWESDIKKNLPHVVKKITEAIKERLAS